MNTSNPIKKPSSFRTETTLHLGDEYKGLANTQLSASIVSQLVLHSLIPYTQIPSVCVGQDTLFNALWKDWKWEKICHNTRKKLGGGVSQGYTLGMTYLWVNLG